MVTWSHLFDCISDSCKHHWMGSRILGILLVVRALMPFSLAFLILIFIDDTLGRMPKSGPYCRMPLRCEECVWSTAQIRSIQWLNFQDAKWLCSTTGSTQNCPIGGQDFRRKVVQPLDFRGIIGYKAFGLIEPPSCELIRKNYQRRGLHRQRSSMGAAQNSTKIKIY
jgi:hypothetical protein